MRGIGIILTTVLATAFILGACAKPMATPEPEIPSTPILPSAPSTEMPAEEPTPDPTPLQPAPETPQKRYSLSVTASPTEGGSVSPTSELYDSDSLVTIVATPADGYDFVSWSGDVSGSEPTVSIIMDSDKEAVAVFVAAFQEITIIMPEPTFSYSTATFTNTLEKGDIIEGFIEISGEFKTQDWSFDWTGEVIDPDGDTIDIFRGHWVKEPRYDLNVEITSTGEYTIRVRHKSLHEKNLLIHIRPKGWS
jgi:hypothetical protein